MFPRTPQPAAVFRSQRPAGGVRRHVGQAQGHGPLGGRGGPSQWTEDREEEGAKGGGQWGNSRSVHLRMCRPSVLFT